jgi:hypothetical protein
MLDQLLPRRVDNTYRGHPLGLWLFVLIVLAKIANSFASIFYGYVAASAADGIPLDTFTPPAAQAVLSLLALWGLAHLTISLLCTVVLVRYRALIPLMLTLLLLEQVSRKLLVHVMPVIKTGTPPGSWVNLVLIALLVIGLVLSLRSRGSVQTQQLDR